MMQGPKFTNYFSSTNFLRFSGEKYSGTGRVFSVMVYNCNNEESYCLFEENFKNSKKKKKV